MGIGQYVPKLYLLLAYLLLFSAFPASVHSMNTTSQEWSKALASIPDALKWPTAILKLGQELPSVLLTRVRLNPACLVSTIMRSLVPNGASQQLSWPKGERSKNMFDAAFSYNQEVWMGTRHREFLSVNERDGNMRTDTTLSIVSCVQTSQEADMNAVIEAIGSGANWLKAGQVPCGSVRMPSWLVTKKPLKKTKRRERQRVNSEDSDSTGSKAGVSFVSSWYSPFDNVKELSGWNGWVGSTVWNKKGVVDKNYERTSFLDRQDAELVDAGVNLIGFDWADTPLSLDYMKDMFVEACLDDHGTRSCADAARQGSDSMHHQFSYVPWLDKWTFNSSGLADECAHMEHTNSDSVCLEQGREIWSNYDPDLPRLIEATQDSNRPDVRSDQYEAILESCQSKLALSPGNMSSIRFGAGDKSGEEYHKVMMKKARELQMQIYARIPKDDIRRISGSTLFLVLVTGIEGIIVASSWEILLCTAWYVVYCGRRRGCRPQQHQNRQNIIKPFVIFFSVIYIGLALLPIGFLLREELSKVNKMRVDGDILVDTSRRTTVEGDAFLATFFIVSVAVTDESSQWLWCLVLLIFMGGLGLFVVIWRFLEGSNTLREPFSLLGVGQP